MVLKCLRWSPWPAAAYMRSGGLADLPAFARLSGAVEGGPVSRDDDAPDLALAGLIYPSPEEHQTRWSRPQDNFRARGVGLGSP